MKGHITSQELHLVATGGIDPDLLLEVTRHLETCPLCAQRAEGLANLDVLASTMREAISTGDEHPDMTELAGYVNGEIDAEAMEWIDEHLESCTRCSEDVADLRAEQKNVRGGRRMWLGIAAAVVVAFAIGAGIIRLQSGAPAPRSDVWMDLERTVLAAGRIGKPAILRSLRLSADTLRGSETAGESTMHPAGEVIEDDRPPLSWKPVAGARYVVTILADDETVATSDPLTDAYWRPPHSLLRDKTYNWQVEIRKGTTSTIIPAPPQPEALFRIADAPTLASMEAARRAHPGDHLLLGILYARAGMKSRALSELDAHIAAHPRDRSATALADGVRRW